MITIQAILHAIEAGKAQALVRLVPLCMILLVVVLLYDVMIFHGLDDSQSMDNAQVARQIVRGSGFTTQFLRPYALGQLHDYAVKNGKTDLFPAKQFPPGTPRILPDTYNSPGYPYLLAGWFALIHPEFDQPAQEMGTTRIYLGERWIPVLNQIFVILTALLVFALGRDLFDSRIAWLALIGFLGSDMIWQYSITALSTNVLMFLVTAFLFACLKIYSISEACFESSGEAFWPAWLWTLVAALLLAAICLTRLHLLVLLLPLLFFLGMMPKTGPPLPAALAIVVLLLVLPWFWHNYQVSGNVVGSNTPQLLYGTEGYKGNQIYCDTGIPSYEQVFKGVSKKELFGFRWHFEHAWELLGASPLVLLFAAGTLHHFKRQRTNAFRWLIVTCAIFIVGANNVGVITPAMVDPWNTVVVLFPAMVVIGSAIFFIFLDRLNLPLNMFNNIIIFFLLTLTLAPMLITLYGGRQKFFSYPPYYPFYIKSIGQLARSDEWVTTDMPWATAWYADRASLWLPDKLNDFYTFHDDYCPTGLLLLTPVTTDAPMSNLTSGEYKEWFPLFSGPTLPAGFPLTAHANLTQQGLKPDYYFWSDATRWMK